MTVGEVAGLLLDLDRNQIRYVHWKSNINVGRALNADDDLDILVHPSDLALFEEILVRRSYVRPWAQKDEWTPGLAHHYKIDAASSKLVHVHSHDRLTLGFDYDKNYTLPIVDWYLAGRSRVQGIFVPAPEKELAVFAIRTLIKHHLSAKLAQFPRGLLAIFSRSNVELSANERNEFAFLSSQVQADVFEASLSIAGLGIPAGPLLRVAHEYCGPVSGPRVRRDARWLARHLSEYRRKPQVVSWAVSGARLTKQRLAKVFAKAGVLLPRGRVVREGGLAIALVGGDGAGKSTNVQAISAALGRGFWTETIHVGRPSRSVRGTIAKLSGRVLRALGARELAANVSHIGLALDRRASYKRALCVRRRGGIAILDRIPHDAISTMDAPRIRSSKVRRHRWLQTFEARVYAGIQDVDLIVVLKLNPDIALLRRPEDDPAGLRKRSGEVWFGEWPAPRHFVVDTGELGPAAVLTTALDHIWCFVVRPRTRTELLGLSGVGKSSVTRSLHARMAFVAASLPYRSRPFSYALSHVRAARIVGLPRDVDALRILRNLAQALWFVRHWRGLAARRVGRDCNYILDQGPLFQLALLLKERAVSSSDALYAEVCNAFRGWATTPPVRIRVPRKTRVSRMDARISEPHRSGLLETSARRTFDREYRDAFRTLRVDFALEQRVRGDADLDVVVERVLRALRHGTP